MPKKSKAEKPKEPAEEAVEVKKVGTAGLWCLFVWLVCRLAGHKQPCRCFLLPGSVLELVHAQPNHGAACLYASAPPCRCEVLSPGRECVGLCLSL